MEFAITAPMLVVLVLGIADYGLLMADSAALEVMSGILAGRGGTGRFDQAIVEPKKALSVGMSFQELHDPGFVEIRASLNDTQSLDEVKKAIADGNKRIVLNLGETNYIDSGGLGTLVALHIAAHNGGGTIKLANLNKRVGDLMQVTKLLTVFEVHGSEYEALEAFRSAA